jgi:hypothetical protein
LFKLFVKVFGGVELLILFVKVFDDVELLFIKDDTELLILFVKVFGDVELLFVKVFGGVELLFIKVFGVELLLILKDDTELLFKLFVKVFGGVENLLKLLNKEGVSGYVLLKTKEFCNILFGLKLFVGDINEFTGNFGQKKFVF